MTGLESSLGAIAAGLAVGGIGAITLIGRIVNHQVTKSFEHAVNNDEADNPGLRTSLRELRAEVKVMSGKMTLIEQNQAVMVEGLKGRNLLCDERHEVLNKLIEAG